MDLDDFDPASIAIYRLDTRPSKARWNKRNSQDIPDLLRVEHTSSKLGFSVSLTVSSTQLTGAGEDRLYNSPHAHCTKSALHCTKSAHGPDVLAHAHIPHVTLYYVFTIRYQARYAYTYYSDLKTGLTPGNI